MMKINLEQERYARFLAVSANGGLVLLIVAFIVYVTGMLEPHVPLERLPELWGQSAAEFSLQSGLPGGWDSFAYLHRGDVINIAGIGMLALCSVPGLAAVIPVFASRGERIMPVVCALQIGVIALAASGLLAGSH